MVIYGQTDVGKVRESNQDMYCFKVISDNLGFAVVCDGMGGENGGKVASKIACDTIYKYLDAHLKEGLDEQEYKNIMVTAVSDGNVAVYDYSLEKKEYIGMGTTVVALVVVNNKAYIAHVGDSRVYMLKSGEFYQITKDHSLVQNLVEQGKITQEQAKNHPQKNMITRAVGVSFFVDVDYIQVNSIKDVSFLLCSDGLTNSCDNEQIKSVLENTPKESVCKTLIDMANDAGGIDNITAVYIA